MTEHISTSQFYDYIDAVLDAPVRAQCAAHLEVCAACRDELAVLAGLVAQVGALPREIAPPRDLRAGIAERLAGTPATSPRAQRRTRVTPLLAAAAVLIIITASVTRWWLGQNVRPAVSLQPTAASSALPASFRIQEDRYVSEIAGVQRALDREREHLSPVTTEIVARNMAVIDRAIAEARAALANDPANRDLGHMVLSAYEQKLDLLRRARSIGI